MEKCKLCKGNTKTVIHEKFGTFHWCRDCDFIFKDKSDHISEEKELEIYNSHQNSIDDPRYVAYFKRFIEAAIISTGKEFKEGFDFGSGPSPVLATILERDYGIDMDIYDLNYAPNKTYLDKKYDLVTCTEVIEHLENPQEYFDLLASLMKDDGLLAMMTLFHPESEADFLNWHYIRDRTHISLFTPRTFAYMAEKSGLKVAYHNDHRYITFKKR